MQQDNLKLALIISICLLAIACGYIITKEMDFCEQAKNESYNAGFNQGVEQWNSAVIYGVNTKGVIPYWFNNSYYELNINQICGGKSK